MINVNINSVNGNITSLTCKGHSLQNVKGKDIVCAGVSAVIIGGLNALDIMAGKENFKFDVKDGYVKIECSEMSEVQNVLKVMIIQLKSIEESYGKFIKIVESYQ